VQATLLELTARSLTDAIIQLEGLATQPEVEVYVCGGGAQNKQLLKRCQELTNTSNLPEKMAWLSTEALGVHPDWVEGVLFAWLAWAHCAGKQINLSSVTGASRPTILGGYFPAN
jgi:anhydro-N-acetylmuramic acid kinase